MLQRVRVAVALSLFGMSLSVYSLEPEDILGEYWKDPLFGVASAENVQKVEVLYKLLFPQEMEVFSGQRTRFVFENKTEEVHVFLFSDEPSYAMRDKQYQAFVKDEVMHATMPGDHSGGHDHSSGSGNSAAKSMVGSLEDKPTMTLQPNDTREIIIRFDKPTTLTLRCVLEDHADMGHESRILVKDGSFLTEQLQ